MSGTRKMEKFEVDAFTKAPDDERQSTDAEAEAKDAGVGVDAKDRASPQTGGKAAQAEKDAAAAIADIEPSSALDGLVPTGPAPIVDLPARPFEPRQPTPEGAPESGAVRATLPTGTAAPAIVSLGTGTAAIAPGQGEVHQSQTPTPPEGAWVPGEWVPPQSDDAPPPSSSSGGAQTPEDADALRTRLARKFITLADSVGEAFKEFAIGAGAWAVELTAPQGMSTGGGKQALQHLRLRPRRDGYSALVAGTVNQVERRAELRDFDHVAILHEVRFRHTLEISSQEWEQFLRKAEVVLNGAGIQSMRTPPPRDLLEQRRNMQRVSKGAVAALIVVLLLAALVVWRVAIALSASP